MRMLRSLPLLLLAPPLFAAPPSISIDSSTLVVHTTPSSVVDCVGEQKGPGLTVDYVLQLTDEDGDGEIRYPLRIADSATLVHPGVFTCVDFASGAFSTLVARAGSPDTPQPGAG